MEEENVIDILGHEHPVVLVDLQPEYPHYEEYHVHDDDDNDDDDEEEELIKEYWNKKWDFNRTCNLCSLEINYYHRYHYKCGVDQSSSSSSSSSSCDDYFLHKSCAELPKNLTHPSHHKIGHTLTLYIGRKIETRCDICRSYTTAEHPIKAFYECSKCSSFKTHVKCVVAHKVNQTIYHPTHPHPLVSFTSQPVLHKCSACGMEHEGLLYHCTTCFHISIQSNCVFLPKKWHFLQHIHHPLILSYSFPEAEQRLKFFPRCRICRKHFVDDNLWIYKCEKCWYYVHLDCVKGSTGYKMYVKNFTEKDNLDRLNLPFPDQTYSVPKITCADFQTHKLENPNPFHHHPLSLVPTQTESLSCHNPMKKIQVLCDGCLTPIMGAPFFKCTFANNQGCNFVLHEWCARLPNQVPNHPAHPQHPLTFFPKVPILDEPLGVFFCVVCALPCNGFVYGCKECKYYIDVTCAFIPKKITHEAHPDHLFKFKQTAWSEGTQCLACLAPVHGKYFHCDTCDVDLHIKCALLLPKTIRHKYDKHPMNLTYLPVENHKSQYFCEICEQEFNPELWFYHCKECEQSIHSACAPLVLESEKDVFSWCQEGVYEYVNIKFGGILNIEDHSHSLVFAQGIASDGRCKHCDFELRYFLIFKCLCCPFGIHYSCCPAFRKLGFKTVHM